MELSSLLPAIVVGASLVGPKVAEIAGTEVIKEMTKDAYKALKETLIAICGRRATRALENVEVEPASAVAQAELSNVISDIPETDQAEVAEKLRALVDALREDPGARRIAAAVTTIKIEVDSGGHVRFDTITGAETIEISSKSVGNFDFTNVHMGKGNPEGN
jgi:hypothetical protein